MDSSIRSLDDHEAEEVNPSGAHGQRGETVGGYLIQIREAKGLSLAEIAQLTKISEHYLKCIEKDDFELIPKGPYVKGYITNYTRMIGGDTEKALGLYSALNEEKETIEETLPEASLAAGWKASLANMLFSVCDRIKERKMERTAILPKTIGAPSQPQTQPSVLEIRKTPGNVVQDTEKEHLPAVENKHKDVSSVLIPFKRVASPLPPTQPHTPAPVHASTTEAPAQTFVDSSEAMPSKSTVQKAIVVKAAILAFFHKLIEGLGYAGSWIKAKQSKLKTINITWPAFPRSFWATLTGIVAGVSIMVFCAIGVYHVFFFNPQGLEATEAKDASDNKGETVLASLTQVPMEHKTARFKKPEASSLQATATVLPPAEPVQHQTKAAPKAAPKPTIVPVDKPAQSAPIKVAAAAPPVRNDKAQPAETKIRVLKATICSAIKDKHPADSINTFPLSVDRVYVWSHVEAKQYPTTIMHTYYHEGEMINQVELPVRGSFWRTWSFKSIDKDNYQGHWRVDITTADSGKVLRRLYFEIK